MGICKISKFLLCFVFFLIVTAPLYSYDIYAGRKIGPVNMGMALVDALRGLKNPVMKELRGKVSDNFFVKILKLPEAGILRYSSLFYCPDLNIVLLTEKGKVTAVAVTAEEGLLEGVVDVKRGIEPVLVFYGKAGMTIVKRNEHRIYIYKERRIMFFDDNGNGTVDMIIIWMN